MSLQSRPIPARCTTPAPPPHPLVSTRGVTASRRARLEPVGALAGAGSAVLVATMLTTAPEPPAWGEGWRWATIAVGAALSTWNVVSACQAYRTRGITSAVGFLHLWLLFAFSLPAAEMTYRYSSLSFYLWRLPTDDPLLFRAAVLVALFQVLFFAVLGRDVDARGAAALLASRPARPRPRLAVLFLLLLAPLVLARLQVLSILGVQGAARAAVTRTDYLRTLEGQVHPVVVLLNTAFPVFAVTLLCLAVKYAVAHPTSLGRRLYVAAMVGCAAGVLLTGGRAELVYVAFTVVVFLYVSGYRTLRQFAPVLVPVGVIALVLVLVAQARTGQSNALTSIAGNPYVGSSYARGDVTQLLGLGRFDAVVMILDQHDPRLTLQGSSYWWALTGLANATLLPRIALGDHLPIWHVTDSVMGPWVFGTSQLASPLPSAPGELFLNFGVPGVLIGALVLGGVTRLALGLPTRIGGTVEFAWLLVLWTLARFLTDESYLMAMFVGRTWPLMLALSLLVLATVPTARTPGRATAGKPPGGAA